jgi:hypothetical protein
VSAGDNFNMPRASRPSRPFLEKLFGEDVTGVVIEEQIRNFNQAREHQALGIAGAGILTHVEAPHVVRVPKHTYHGK